MSNEINVGMKFGTYDAKVEECGKRLKCESDTECYKMGLESSYDFKDYVSGEKKAAAVRSAVSKHKNLVFFATAYFTEGSYSWGTSAKVQSGWLNKFDYIETQNQHAVDLNNNGQVDDGEIFSGKLNEEAYDKAKESGDLNNYINYLS